MNATKEKENDKHKQKREREEDVISTCSALSVRLFVQ